MFLAKRAATIAAVFLASYFCIRWIAIEVRAGAGCIFPAAAKFRR